MTVLKQTVVVSAVACLPDDAERTPKKRKKKKKLKKNNPSSSQSRVPYPPMIQRQMRVSTTRHP
jgi:hypothetical protein